MHRTLLALLLLLALPLLAACSFDRLTAQQDQDLRAVYEKMRTGDLAGIEGAFHPQFKREGLHQSLAFMQGMIPLDSPRSALLKSAVQTNPDGSTDYGGMYEYDYRDTAVLAEIQMRQDKAGRKTITTVQMRQAPVGVAGAFDFGLAGKKPYQYIFLFLMALSPVFGLWGLVHLWRAKDIKWKFLWALAMMVGFMDLTMDWRTGDVVLNVAYVHPLWIYARKFGPLSPWMLSTSLPVAAIAFLLGYRRLERPWDPPKKAS